MNLVASLPYFVAVAVVVGNLVALLRSYLVAAAVVVAADTLVVGVADR